MNYEKYTNKNIIRYLCSMETKENKSIVNKITDSTFGIIVVSVIAVGIFYLFTPKHWWEVTLVSPIPPIP